MYLYIFIYISVFHVFTLDNDSFIALLYHKTGFTLDNDSFIELLYYQNCKTVFTNLKLFLQS